MPESSARNLGAMNASGHNGDKMPIAVEGIRDLSEFHLNWGDFRPLISALQRDRERLDEDERAILGWLILLADRIGDDDLMRR